MSKNQMAIYLKRAYDQGFQDGQELGHQQMLDAATIYHARNGWRLKRLLDFFKGVQAILSQYDDAFHSTMEQDVQQARMDAEIMEGLQDEKYFTPFECRYPTVVKPRYDVMPKK